MTGSPTRWDVVGAVVAGAVLMGCAGSAAPDAIAPTPDASGEADPWRVPSSDGVALGEPDPRFVPLPSPRAPRSDEAPSDGSLGSLRDGPTGSPPEARAGAHAVVAGLARMRASMRRCFAKALAADPNVRAPSAAKVDFGPDGKPARVTFGGKPPRSGTVEPCLAEVLLRGVEPAEGAATIVIPFTEGDL